MMRNVYLDDYAGRVFDLPRNNCWHFARDVWRDMTGVDLGDLTPAKLQPRSLSGAASAYAQSARFRRVLPGPAPSIALAERPGWMPHVGILLRGRILSLSRNGVRHEAPTAFVTGFHSLGFFVPEDSAPEAA